MNEVQKYLPVLSLIVGLLTLYMMWEQHQLHRLDFEEKCARRRERMGAEGT